MVESKVFCADCKIRISKNWYGQREGTEFEDGWRCESCAVKIKRK